MILEHLAAILFFSGPVVYVGLWMVIDPAGIAWLAEFVMRVFRSVARSLSGQPSEIIVEQAYVSRRLRTGLRLAGVALLLFAIVV